MVRRLKLWLTTAHTGWSRAFRSTPFVTLIAVLVISGSGLLSFFLQASGDQVLPARSINILNSTVDAVTTYTLTFTIATPATLGSISAQFCSNDPLVIDPCTVPAGFNIANATLSAQSGETGFSIGAGTTANQLILSRTPSLSTVHSVSYTLTNVQNPSVLEPFYVRLQTFATSDGSGAETDHGGIALTTVSNINLTSIVPPYLLFCSGIAISSNDCSTSTGDYINFGNFSSAATSSSQTQLLVATNATSGYFITYDGSTLTSGNNIIDPLTNPDVSRPGVGQFGINLTANQDPAIGENQQGNGSGTVTANYAQPNSFRFDPDDVIASSTGTSDYTLYTVSYIANVPADQAAGVYVSTLTYVATANF